MAAAVTVEKADVLQSFWGLSSLDEEKRVESSRELITALLKKQVGNAITPPLRSERTNVKSVVFKECVCRGRGFRGRAVYGSAASEGSGVREEGSETWILHCSDRGDIT